MDLLTHRLCWMLTWFLVLGMNCSADAAFVNVRESLKVKRGQWAYLQPRHLHFLVPQQKDSCKLEVVLNEPITQRVGELMPQVFDCSYLSEEVKYVHNGCPLLKKDEVKLRLYWFTETHTYTEDISLHVDIMEPDCSVIRLGPKALSVPHLYGVSNAIDGDVVSFHYERRSSLECSVHLNTHGSQLPAHGQVVTGEPEMVLKRGDEPESFIHLRQHMENQARAKCSSVDCLKGLKMVTLTKVSCDDFLMMGLRYHHTEPPSPNVDYITITLHLKDTKSGTIYQTEEGWIPVQIIGAIPNQPPRPSFSSMFLLEVDQFILTPLSTATLDADDEENPKELLVFNITRPPKEGFITHLSDHTHPITSFTWTDLNHMLIGYQPPNSSHDQRHSYQAELEVHDLFFEKSSKITVHMSVRNSDTHAPRVSWNMGLSLLEGQSRPITWEQLQVVDNDDLNAVRIIIIDGLHHGHITVKEERSFMFSISDITAGLVCYHHDDSDSTKDFVIFRITDGRHQTRHKFPIKILPKDDTPPFLITNMLLEVPEGSTALLGGSILQASDMDSSDDYVMFNITRPPHAGHVIKVPGPGLMGYSVTSFQQRELSHSTIFYQHHHNQALEDSFEVVLSDSHQPPNLSQPQVVMVQIEPVPDRPPVEASTASRCVTVKETDVVHITRKHLHFIDKHSVDGQLTYTVTTPPFFTSRTSSIMGPDAGRLFLVDSVPTLTKDASTAALKIFTQHAVNFLKVAYMPPILDIGPHPQEVQVVLSVTNQHGQSVTGLCLNITVLPVDNQPPQVVFQPVSVDEGGDAWIDWDHLLLSDVDSVEHALRVELRAEPRHGAVWFGGLTLKVGQTFTVQDLRVPNIRYIHDGSETTHDSIELSADDGTNAVPFILPVKVFPVNDEVPVLVAGLKPVLTCPEGQEVVISPDYIYATDADSEGDELVFLIARQPNRGTVLRHGLEVDRFVQGDVRAGIISYRHTGEEVGVSPTYDIVTIVISDEDSEEEWCCGRRNQRNQMNQMNSTTRTTTGDVELRGNLPVYDLHITVVPVDNQTPEIATGDVFKVDEGGVALITASHLKALDSDTDWENLTISVTSTPQYGYVENVLPTPGSEKSNAGQSITSFSYQDVMEGNIRYVQSRHQGLEPTADHFLLRVSDGKHSSTQVPFYVIIVPTNDETPRFTANNVTVLEGERVQLDSSVFYADDDDVPEDVLLLSVIEPPQHGTIVITENNSSTSAGLHFTMTDLNNGLMLTYTHDDSEKMKDIFTIQLTDGQHTVIRHVGITVEPVNDEQPTVIRNDGVEVNVGESRLISSLSLFAGDVDTPSSHIYYMLETVPRHGILQVKEGDEWVNLSSGTNVTQEAVNMNHVRYVHTNRLTSEKTDVFVFHLNDGINRSPSQYFTMSLKDMGTGNIGLFVNPVNVSRGARLLLSSDVLLAVDGSDRADEMVYTITTPPTSGHVENLRSPGVVLSSFSQMDVAANLVCYVHDNRASSSSDTLKFAVGNGRTSRRGTVQIQIETLDRVLPSLSLNKDLTVPRGSSVILGPDFLSVVDPDTPPSLLTLVLLKPPQYGTLVLGGTTMTSGSRFTQRNILDLEVVYKHDGGRSQIDAFSFTVSDGTNQGFLLDGHVRTEPVFLTVQILLLDQRPPEVVELLPLWEVEQLPGGRSGIFLSSRELKVLHSDSTDEQLIFCIQRAPHFGYLENISTGGFVTGCFSQKELTSRTLVYVVDVDRELLSDSLIFSVSGPLGNAGTSHTLDFRWSSVELSRPAWTTCEDQGTFSVELVRKGNLANLSFVTIKVTEGTATSQRDFLTNDAFLIQFDPGVINRKWPIELVQDHLEEAEETLEVQLVSAEGTIIGTINKALITIKDSGRGQCQRTPQQPKEGSVSVSVLGGTAVVENHYPQHGSIQLERLPIGSGSVLFNPGSQTGPRTKKVSVVSRQRSISPSSVFHNGTDTVYTYHGIMQTQGHDGDGDGDDGSPSRQGRKAHVQLVNGRAHTDRPIEQGPVIGQQRSHVTCVPELMGLMHFNHTINELLYCNGVSWKPWRTVKQHMVRAQMCPDGWSYHGEHCYILSTGDKLTWSLANTACREQFKGTLASVRSKADMDWLWNFSGREPFWIGLSRRGGRGGGGGGGWQWSDGERVIYTNWRTSPRVLNMGSGRSCVLVWKRARWYPRDCRRSPAHGFVCSMKINNDLEK